MAVQIPLHYHFSKVSADTLVLPASSVTNEKVLGPIDADKLGARMHLGDSQAPGTAIVAKTTDIRICRAAGLVLDIDAAITGALADDASRHVTVDLQKSTGGAAFATMLSAVIDLTMSDTVWVAVAGTLAGTPSFVAGDILRLVTAVSGSSGNQAQGLQVSVTTSEVPN